MPVIGFLHPSSLDTYAQHVDAFRRGLNETGWIEDQKVTIEYRWADGRYERLPALAADLVRRQVAVIALPGSTPSALAAKAATSTIPIVFAVVGDPIALGFVASLNRPGGNMTGVTLLNVAVVAKRFELLHELVPTAAVLALLVNPANPQQTAAEISELQTAARALALELNILNVRSESDFDAAFTDLVQRGAKALIVRSDPLFTNGRKQLVALAERHAVPAIYGTQQIAAAGGLMSYSNDLADSFRQVGIYTGRILKGAKVADLPVQQPTHFQFVINLKTAKALGLEIPPKLLALADEVIE